MGLKREAPEETAVPDGGECYPDNWLAFLVFSVMETQWAIGPNGRVRGLKYEALPVVLEALSVNQKRRAEVLGKLRIMENAALELFAKNG